jgi:hypothetical protein
MEWAELNLKYQKPCSISEISLELPFYLSTVDLWIMGWIGIIPPLGSGIMAADPPGQSILIPGQKDDTWLLKEKMEKSDSEI